MAGLFVFFNAVAILVLLTAVLVDEATGASAKGGWSDKPTQYHIQTDEGPERYFKYQTLTGQYRKEKRLEDGTVIGTYGWVDPTGMLLLKDYVADNSGYRIVKSRKIFVGDKQADPTPVIATTTPAPPVTTARPFYRPPTPAPSVYEQPGPTTYRPPNKIFRPTEYDSSPQTDHRPPTTYVQGPSYPQAGGYEQNSVYPEYDGVSTYHNGFRYFLPRQYHEEESSPAGDTRTGSFGYIDPFGIRRVVYYNTAPGTGFLHKKNNRYVGFNATPYDPRPSY